MEDLEAQIVQLHAALEVAEEEDKAGILTIIQDLQTLISSIQNEGLVVNDDSASSTLPKPDRDPDEEFLRFQEELKSLESGTETDTIGQETKLMVEAETSSSSTTDPSINEDLDALVGMSCKAPFMVQWGQIGYYNAVVFSVEPLNQDSEDGDSINVRVVFTQPLSVKMRTCPYFLSGSCRFESDCKFSHGQIVALSHLKDYKEPDFSTLAKGSRVLAKYSDDLWYHAIISSITDSGMCELTYENYGEEATIPLHDTLPLHEDKDGDEGDIGSSSSELSDCSDTEDSSSCPTADEAPIVWVHMKGTSALGVWEQYTRGIGSKLMAKMGYVFGTGLGKHGEGRVEPVDAVIIPAGRSLDTIMHLKEKAGGSGSNLFSAERHLKRLQKRKKEQDAKLESKEKQSQSMFNFLNDRLNTLSKDKNHRHHHRRVTETVVSAAPHKESETSLNKQLLSVTERIRQVLREKAKCQQSLKRHEGRDQTTVDRINEKLTYLDTQFAELKRSEEKINNEQQHRSDKKKLTIF